MRNAFADEMTRIASEDRRLTLLSGDIGNRLFDRFKEAAPDRFINCGIAEANMIGTAAGLAMCGLKPVAYTITPFITTRCLEQIKIDVCYHNTPVVIVGVGGGLSYASLGATHHSFEDIAILRVLPRLQIVCPGDPVEVRFAIRAALQSDAPTYIRLGKKGEEIIHTEEPSFTIGKGIPLREGKDVCILSTGNVLPLALQCADALSQASISPRVVSLHTVKPLDTDILSDAFSKFAVVATIEEHSLIGGLGGSVAEWLSSQEHFSAKLLRFGLDDAFICDSGNQNQTRKAVGLSPEFITPRIIDCLRRRS